LQGDKVLLDEVLGAGFSLLRYSDKSGEVSASQFITPTDDIWAKLAELQTARGWGLFLIKNLVDDMHITSDETHHTVELIMNL